jgi:hypothetical protein
MGSVTVCFKSEVHRTSAGRQVYGTKHFTEGTRYDGHMLNGLPHGEGRMYFTNGDWYQGTFRKGLRHGEGTYTFLAARQRWSGHWHGDVFVRGATYCIA